MAPPEDYATARQAMVKTQIRRRGIRDSRVLEAMCRVPRERFVPAEEADEAYSDNALPIDCGQTISQPYMVALMTEALQLTGRERVLEIGTGSGYQAAVLSQLAAEVVSIERHGEMLAPVREALAELGYDNVQLVAGDGTLGWPPAAPYDRIIVTAQAESCPPALVEQLAEGGLMVIPLGSQEMQILTVLRKRGEQLERRELGGCRFVPLVAG